MARSERGRARTCAARPHGAWRTPGTRHGSGADPHAGEIFCFRGRRGDLVKLLWHDGVGMSLYVKRLEAGKFIWPASQSGAAVPISAAQLDYLLEGIDWRNPRWTQRPVKAG